MNQEEKALNEFVKYVELNPSLQAAIKADPIEGTKAAATAAVASGALGAVPDNPLYRAVIWFLGLTMLMVVGGSIILAWLDKTPPDVVIAIGSAAVGALAGLLSPSPSQAGK